MRIVEKLNFKLLSKPSFPKNGFSPGLPLMSGKYMQVYYASEIKVRQNLNTEITLKKYCCYEEHSELPSYRTQLSLSLANGMSSMLFY